MYVSIYLVTRLFYESFYLFLGFKFIVHFIYVVTIDICALTIIILPTVSVWDPKMYCKL